jgi:hypothetical protein
MLTPCQPRRHMADFFDDVLLDEFGLEYALM